MPAVTYAEALDVALCCGWIDGQVKSLDGVSYIQKFTPRRKNSLWSKRNIEYVARLEAAGLVLNILTNCCVKATIPYVMLYNRLAVLRTERGISRNELAEKVGVNYQTIGFIERGDYSPSLELAFKIARVFGVSVTAIFLDKPFESLFKNEQE